MSIKRKNISLPKNISLHLSLLPLFSLLRLFSLVAFILVAATTLTSAQTDPAPTLDPQNTPPQQNDPGFDAAQQAYNALSESDRKAIQDALIWTGDYIGSVSGDFSKRTYNSILTYQKKLHKPASGIFDQPSREQLYKTANNLKLSNKFNKIQDKTANFPLMLPQALLIQSNPTSNGTIYSNVKDTVSLTTFSIATTTTSLAQLYDQYKADSSDRKVTYKLFKPDFFVVSGEADHNVFYTRFSAKAGVEYLFGYTFIYPAAAKGQFDKFSIAIANGFDPFDLGGNTNAPNDQSTRSAAQSSPSSAKVMMNAPIMLKLPESDHVNQQSGSPVIPMVDAISPQLSSTGVVIAPGKVFVANLPKNCSQIIIANSIARIEKNDDKGIILAASTLNGNAAQFARPTKDAEIVVFSYNDAQDHALTVSPGALAGEKNAIVAALASTKTGGVVFDHSGRAIGMVGPPGDKAPVHAYYNLIPLNGSTSTPPSDPLSTGEIVAKVRATVLPVYCTTITPPPNAPQPAPL